MYMEILNFKKLFIKLQVCSNKIPQTKTYLLPLYNIKSI